MDNLPSVNDTNAASGRNGPAPKLIALVIVAAIAATFVLQNRERKSVDFLFFEINSRQWVNIAVAVILGIVIDRLFTSWWRRRGKQKS